MSDLHQEWREFHEANPHVYELICRFAKEAISIGRKEYAIGTIWERMRWHMNIERGDAEFKLPNNHRAYYARLWLDEHPNFPKFFQTCCLRSEGGTRDRYGRTEDDRPSP